MATCSGIDKAKSFAHKPHKQVAGGEHYLLWWDPPGANTPEPVDSAELLRQIAEKP